MIESEMMFAWEGERSRGSWGEVPIVSLRGSEMLSDAFSYAVSLRWPPGRDVDPLSLIRARAAIRLSSRGHTTVVHGEITSAGDPTQGDRCDIVLRPLFARADRRRTRHVLTHRRLADVVTRALGVEPADDVARGDGSMIFAPTAESIVWRTSERAGIEALLDEVQGSSETDLAFVRRVLDASGYVFGVEHGRGAGAVVVTDRGVGRGPAAVLRDGDLARVRLDVALGDDDEEVTTAVLEGPFAGLAAGASITLDVGRASARGDYVIESISTFGGVGEPLRFEARCARIGGKPRRAHGPTALAHTSQVFEQNLHVSTGLNKVELIGANSALAVGANEDVEISGKQTIAIGDGRVEDITGDLDQKVSGRVDQTLGSITRVVSGASAETFAGPHTSVFIGLRASVSSSIDVASFGSLSLRTGATASIESVAGPLVQRAEGPSVIVSPVHLVASGITILS